MAFGAGLGQAGWVVLAVSPPASIPVVAPLGGAGLRRCLGAVAGFLWGLLVAFGAGLGPAGWVVLAVSPGRVGRGKPLL